MHKKKTNNESVWHKTRMAGINSNCDAQKKNSMQVIKKWWIISSKYKKIKIKILKLTPRPESIKLHIWSTK